ncbi:MAG: hypothetical protein K8F58_16745 [Bauldia sp.]|nr:hypothetical protein [Bauldia sp.]
MSGLRPSYIGRARRRQPAGGRQSIGEAAQRQSPPFIRAMVLGAAILSVAGCARLGLPFEAGSVATNAGIPPGKPVISAKVADGVDPSDWQTVREALSGMAAGETGDGLDWRNPATGSAGTITAYAAGDTPAGFCRVFATTVNDMRGVRRYRGQACIRGGDWKLTGVTPEDGELL